MCIKRVCKGYPLISTVIDLMSNWQAAEEGDIQDDFEFDLEATNKNEKDSILFLIDCGPEMFLPNEHLKYLEANAEESSSLTAFQAAMKCISSTMKNKIICSESDRIGVICYNTGKSRNPAGFPYIYNLQDLDIPDAPSILEIEKFVRKPEAFKDKFGSSDAEFPFGNVFWTIANIFADKKFIGSQKRVFLFTCEDNPNGRNESLQRAAKTRGKDMNELGISLELFALPKPTGSIFKPFNYKQFYSAMIPDLEGEDQLSKFEELLSRVRRRETRKRALARTEMSLGPSMNLSVKLFSLYMETKKGQYIWQHEKTGKLATPKTEWICKETGRPLETCDFKFSFDYGGEKIVFTRDEMGQIYKFEDEIGLKVLGFKPRSVLKTSHNVTHSTFVYPDETITGSVATFACLLKNCLEMDKLVLCRWTARRGAPPRLVALLPQAEKIDEIGTQVKAPGFNMIILPFADDIRHLRFNEDPSDNRDCSNVASHEQIDKAKALITKLALPGGFKPDSYDNPVLQNHYANLQALALDQEIEGELEDCTLPAYDRIKIRAETEISEFIDAIGLKDVISAEPSKPTSAKRSKTSDDFDPITAITAVKNDPNALAKFTVNDLKSYLESIGIKAKRVKSEIIDQIYNQ